MSAWWKQMGLLLMNEAYIHYSKHWRDCFGLLLFLCLHGHQIYHEHSCILWRLLVKTVFNLFVFVFLAISDNNVKVLATAQHLLCSWYHFKEFFKFLLYVLFILCLTLFIGVFWVINTIIQLHITNLMIIPLPTIRPTHPQPAYPMQQKYIH